MSVTTIVLGPGDSEAIAKAIKLLWIDGIDREAMLQQCFDHWSARRLDRDRDLRRLCARDLDEPGAQLQQSSSIVSHITLGHALARGIDHAGTMLIPRPIEAY